MPLEEIAQEVVENRAIALHNCRYLLHCHGYVVTQSNDVYTAYYYNRTDDQPLMFNQMNGYYACVEGTKQ